MGRRIRPPPSGILVELPIGRELRDADIEWVESESESSHDNDERHAGSLARLTMRSAQDGHPPDPPLFGKLVRLPEPVLHVSKRVVEQIPITLGLTLIFKNTKEDAQALSLDTKPLAGEIDQAMRRMEVLKLQEQQCYPPLYRHASCIPADPLEIYCWEEATDEEVTDESDSEEHPPKGRYSSIKRRHSA